MATPRMRTTAQARQAYYEHRRRLNQANKQVAVASTQLSAVTNAYLGRAREVMMREYRISLERAYGASMQQTFDSLPERATQLHVKGVDEIERATIGATQVAQQDNRDLREAMRRFAEIANQNILLEYRSQFPGRSYRTGPPDRRSGGMERFLNKRTIVRARGMEVVASLESAINDDDVPHIFRLNYGAEAAPGAAGVRKFGRRAPQVRISLFPGSAVHQVITSESRQPSFNYPGGGFGFKLTRGAAGQVQLYRSSDAVTSGQVVGGGVGSRPSAGIAPNYFVEYGLEQSMRSLRELHSDVLRRWRDRVARISGTG